MSNKTLGERISSIRKEKNMTQKLLNTQTKQDKGKADDIINIALIGIALAMGICIIVTSVLKQIAVNNAITMLGIGLSCLSIYLLKNKKNRG